MNALQISQFIIRYVDTQCEKQSSIPPVYDLMCPKLQPKHSLGKTKTTIPLLTVGKAIKRSILNGFH
jgi:hypothetical protein